jgi:hypothetical protein
MIFLKKLFSNINNYIKYNKFEILTYFIFFIFIFFLFKLSLFLIFFIKISFYFFKNFFINIYSFIENFFTQIIDSDAINFKKDLDSTTNTDGEDSLVYLNDFIEITLSERSIFFDVILANPFEYSLFILSSLLIGYFLLNDKIKSPLSLFKTVKIYFKNKFKNK